MHISFEINTSMIENGKRNKTNFLHWLIVRFNAEFDFGSMETGNNDGRDFDL